VDVKYVITLVAKPFHLDFKRLYSIDRALLLILYQISMPRIKVLVTPEVANYWQTSLLLGQTPIDSSWELSQLVFSAAM
jgi:hypothetical protein